MRASSRRRIVSWLVACSLGSACATPLARFEETRPKMGTSFRLVIYAESHEQAARAFEAAFARVDELDALLSDYDEASELSRLSAHSDAGPSAPVPVSEELATVLSASLHWAEVSDGAFDPTVGPFVRLWRRSVRQGELPSAARVAEARAAVGWRALEVDEAARTVRLGARAMRLDLGAIAKGYTLDECVRALAREGVECALVDGGGDLVAAAAPPGERGWAVAVEPYADGTARVVLELEHAALATSGDAYRFVELEGARYSHVVDPRTGLGSTRRASATVFARDGMTADALATAACVLGVERGVEFLAGLAGVEGRVVELTPDGARASETAGFVRLARDGDDDGARAP